MSELLVNDIKVQSTELDVLLTLLLNVIFCSIHDIYPNHCYSFKWSLDNEGTSPLFFLSVCSIDYSFFTV